MSGYVLPSFQVLGGGHGSVTRIGPGSKQLTMEHLAGALGGFYNKIIHAEMKTPVGCPPAGSEVITYLDIMNDD